MREQVESLRARIAASVGPEDRYLRRYERRYQQGLESFRRAATREDLVRAVAAADIAYVGDYHSLSLSQQTFLRLLRAVLPRRSEVVLALEMVHAEDQGALDAYLAGALDESGFLSAIDYARRWGFAFDVYREIFALARERGLAVLGINSAPVGRGVGSSRGVGISRGDPLAARDRASAAVLAAARARFPGALILVLDGDLHVAPPHLPARVRRALGREGRRLRQVVVYQNSTRLYWQLAEAGREQDVDAVEVGGGAWCVFSATPLVKLHSYLNWLEGDPELLARLPLSWRDDPLDQYSYEDQVHGFIQTIALFLGIEADLEHFSVYTGSDLDFLSVLVRRRLYTRPEIDVITEQIRRAESYFIPKGNIIYLASLSINHAAEEAAHYINTVCAGYADAPLGVREDFYYRCVKEAIGYFGSKLINHKRACPMEADFRRFLAEQRGRRLVGDLAFTRPVARWVLRHKEMERQAARGRRLRLRRIYELDTDRHLAVTHALGYILGEKLHRALMRGNVTRAEIRELFHERFEEEGRAREVYMDLVGRLG